MGVGENGEGEHALVQAAREKMGGGAPAGQRTNGRDGVRRHSARTAAVERGYALVGYPVQEDHPGAAASLPEARRLLAEEKYAEAQQLIERSMLGMPGQGVQPYQPLGDLILEFAGSRMNGTIPVRWTWIRRLPGPNSARKDAGRSARRLFRRPTRSWPSASKAPIRLAWSWRCL